MLCLGAVIALFLAYDLRQTVPPDWEGLELYIIPIAGFTAIALWIPRQALRLGLVAGAIGALLIAGFVNQYQSIRLLSDRSYLRVDALAWGLLALIVTAFCLSWWESKVPWRQVAGWSVLALLAGAFVAYGLYASLVILWLMMHPLTF